MVKKAITAITILNIVSVLALCTVFVIGITDEARQDALYPIVRMLIFSNGVLLITNALLQRKLKRSKQPK